MPYVYHVKLDVQEPRPGYPTPPRRSTPWPATPSNQIGLQRPLAGDLRAIERERGSGPSQSATGPQKGLERLADVEPSASAQHSLRWQPGTWGKGIIFRDGSIHTWPTSSDGPVGEGMYDQWDGWPFHTDYIIDVLGNNPPSKPEQFFVIEPNGNSTFGAHYAEYVQAADPRLQPGGSRSNEWKFASERKFTLAEGERTFDQSNYKDQPNMEWGKRRPYLVDGDDIYLGQPGTHHVDVYNEFKDAITQPAEVVIDNWGEVHLDEGFVRGRDEEAEAWLAAKLGLKTSWEAEDEGIGWEFGAHTAAWPFKPFKWEPTQWERPASPGEMCHFHPNQPAVKWGGGAPMCQNCAIQFDRAKAQVDQRQARDQRHQSEITVHSGPVDPSQLAPNTRIVTLKDGRWLTAENAHHEWMIRDFGLKPEQIDKIGVKLVLSNEFFWFTDRAFDMRMEWSFDDPNPLTKRTHMLTWEVGREGKGLVLNNGEVRTWNINERGSPHHNQMGFNGYNGVCFDIDPNGVVDVWSTDRQEEVSNILEGMGLKPRGRENFGWSFTTHTKLACDCDTDHCHGSCKDCWKHGMPCETCLSNGTYTEADIPEWATKWSATDDVALTAYQAVMESDGVTISLDGTQPDEGFAFSPFKDLEEQVSIDNFSADVVRSYIERHLPELQSADNYLGIWQDGGQIYLDVSQVHDNLALALAKAADAEQLAVFDLATGTTIPVPNAANPDIASEVANPELELRSFTSKLKKLTEVDIEPWEPGHFGKAAVWGSIDQPIVTSWKTDEEGVPNHWMVMADRPNFIACIIYPDGKVNVLFGDPTAVDDVVAKVPGTYAGDSPNAWSFTSGLIDEMPENDTHHNPDYLEWVRQMVQQGYSGGNGKWMKLPNGQRIEWDTDPGTGNPHHFEVTQALGFEGQHDPHAREYGYLYPQTESDGWSFTSSFQLKPWTRGESGKGLVAPDGTIHAWAVNPDFGPHHYQVMNWLDKQQVPTRGLEDYSADDYLRSRKEYVAFFITPNGRVDLASDSRQDPELRDRVQQHIDSSGVDDEDDWHFGARTTYFKALKLKDGSIVYDSEANYHWDVMDWHGIGADKVQDYGYVNREGQWMTADDMVREGKLASPPPESWEFEEKLKPYTPVLEFPDGHIEAGHSGDTHAQTWDEATILAGRPGAIAPDGSIHWYDEPWTGEGPVPDSSEYWTAGAARSARQGHEPFSPVLMIGDRVVEGEAWDSHMDMLTKGLVTEDEFRQAQAGTVLEDGTIHWYPSGSEWQHFVGSARQGNGPSQDDEHRMDRVRHEMHRLRQHDDDETWRWEDEGGFTPQPDDDDTPAQQDDDQPDTRKDGSNPSITPDGSITPPITRPTHPGKSASRARMLSTLAEVKAKRAGAQDTDVASKALSSPSQTIPGMGQYVPPRSSRQRLSEAVSPSHLSPRENRARTVREIGSSLDFRSSDKAPRNQKMKSSETLLVSLHTGTVRTGEFDEDRESLGKWAWVEGMEPRLWQDYENGDGDDIRPHHEMLMHMIRTHPTHGQPDLDVHWTDYNTIQKALVDSGLKWACGTYGHAGAFEYMSKGTTPEEVSRMIGMPVQPYDLGGDTNIYDTEWKFGSHGAEVNWITPDGYPEWTPGSHGRYVIDHEGDEHRWGEDGPEHWVWIEDHPHLGMMSSGYLSPDGTKEIGENWEWEFGSHTADASGGLRVIDLQGEKDTSWGIEGRRPIMFYPHANTLAIGQLRSYHDDLMRHLQETDPDTDWWAGQGFQGWLGEADSEYPGHDWYTPPSAEDQARVKEELTRRYPEFFDSEADDQDEWRFGSHISSIPATHRWDKSGHGGFGKGLIDNEGNVHTWNLDADSAPHHADYLKANGLDRPKSMFIIYPSGNATTMMQDKEENEMLREKLEPLGLNVTDGLRFTLGSHDTEAKPAFVYKPPIAWTPEEREQEGGEADPGEWASRTPFIYMPHLNEVWYTDPDSFHGQITDDVEAFNAGMHGALMDGSWGDRRYVIDYQMNPQGDIPPHVMKAIGEHFKAPVRASDEWRFGSHRTESADPWSGTGPGKFIVTPEGRVYTWYGHDMIKDTDSHYTYAEKHPDIDHEAMSDDLWSPKPQWTMGWIHPDGTIQPLRDAEHKVEHAQLVMAQVPGSHYEPGDENKEMSYDDWDFGSHAGSATGAFHEIDSELGEDEPWKGGRRPLIYLEDRNEVYVGNPGHHHWDLIKGVEKRDGGWTDLHDELTHTDAQGYIDPNGKTYNMFYGDPHGYPELHKIMQSKGYKFDDGIDDPDYWEFGSHVRNASAPHLTPEGCTPWEPGGYGKGFFHPDDNMIYAWHTGTDNPYEARPHHEQVLRRMGYEWDDRFAPFQILPDGSVGALGSLDNFDEYKREALERHPHFHLMDEGENQWHFGSVEYEYETDDGEYATTTPWEPGHQGKGYVTHEGEVVHWKLNEDYEPHHWAVADPMGHNPRSFFHIYEDGTLGFASHMATPEDRELMAQATGTGLGDRDWRFSAARTWPGTRPWTPGEYGKGMEWEGVEYEWAVDNMGNPHHVDLYGEVDPDFTYMPETWNIMPDGDREQLWEEGVPTDPHDTWRFATRWELIPWQKYENGKGLVTPRGEPHTWLVRGGPDGYPGHTEALIALGLGNDVWRYINEGGSFYSINPEGVTFNLTGDNQHNDEIIQKSLGEAGDPYCEHCKRPVEPDEDGYYNCENCRWTGEWQEGGEWRFGATRRPWEPGEQGKGIYHPDHGLLTWPANAGHHFRVMNEEGIPWEPGTTQLIRILPDGGVGGWTDGSGVDPALLAELQKHDPRLREYKDPRDEWFFTARVNTPMGMEPWEPGRPGKGFIVQWAGENPGETVPQLYTWSLWNAPEDADLDSVYLYGPHHSIPMKQFKGNPQVVGFQDMLYIDPQGNVETAYGNDVDLSSDPRLKLIPGDSGWKVATVPFSIRYLAGMDNGGTQEVDHFPYIDDHSIIVHPETGTVLMGDESVHHSDLYQHVSGSGRGAPGWEAAAVYDGQFEVYGDPRLPIWDDLYSHFNVEHKKLYGEGSELARSHEDSWKFTAAAA